MTNSIQQKFGIQLKRKCSKKNLVLPYYKIKDIKTKFSQKQVKKKEPNKHKVKEKHEIFYNKINILKPTKK